MSELKHCPFCGCIAVEHLVNKLNGISYFNIGCLTHGCREYVHLQMCAFPETDIPKERIAWNRRANDTQKD